ncbi:MAG: hypothetical protein LAP21_27935 [Acidobacteriia bacterium]|nr:hypothetical protein [Terriglobia bacterium]
MKTVVRSLMLAAVALLMTAGVAVAQCKPAGCQPKAAGCTPKAGCAPKAAAGCQPKSGCKPMDAKNHGPAKKKTLVGTVSDTACGAKHTMMPGKSDAECTRSCVKNGSKYALVVGTKVYTLEGHADELDKVAGGKAKVTGQVSGDTVQVESVTAAKKKA